MKEIEHKYVGICKTFRDQLFASTPNEYVNGNSVIPLKLNHDKNIALISGADSRGTNSIVELTTKPEAALNNAEIFMLVECTGVLKVGRNGQLTVDDVTAIARRSGATTRIRITWAERTN